MEVARQLGLAPDELAALRGEAPALDRWSPAQRAVFAFAEALSNRPREAVALLRPHFDEAGIVELVTVGAVTVMLNRFASALELPV